MSDIVILGGGVIGVSTAMQLKKKVPKSDTIIVVDRQDEQYYAPSILWVLIGERTPESLYRNPADFFAKNGIRFIHDAAVKIQPGQNKLILKKEGSLAYDILIVGTGADYDHTLFPELGNAGYNLWELEGATQFRKKLEEFNGGVIALMVPEMPIKCIGSIYETAFQLHMLFRKKGVENKVTINIYTPESAPMAKFEKPFSKAVVRLLQDQNININCQSEFIRINRIKSQLEFTDKTEKFDLLAYAPPHRGSAIAKDSGLADEHGWIKVDPYFLKTDRENIFAGGDAVSILTPGGDILPKCGSVATFHALVISRNVLAVLDGKKPEAKYRGTAFYLLENGSGNCMPALGSFYGKKKPYFYTFPNSRWFRILKRYAESRWLSGKPSYPPWI